jgi:hypothetical protein
MAKNEEQLLQYVLYLFCSVVVERRSAVMLLGGWVVVGEVVREAPSLSRTDRVT